MSPLAEPQGSIHRCFDSAQHDITRIFIALNMSLDKRLYVYIVRCADKSYYTGVTNNFERRVAEHNEGIDLNCYTFKRRPVELVFVEEFPNFQLAISFEKQLKGWSRKKKEALIEQNWETLKALSACKNSTAHIHHIKTKEDN